MSNLKNVFKDKVVLVTGHTGFKGSWLALWLNRLGAHVVGLSLEVPTSPANFSACGLEKILVDYRIDVRDRVRVSKVISEHRPDFVFHLAAQPLVRRSYVDPLVTFETNAMGSANILDALRYIDKPVAAVMITSDKAYDNVEWVWGYRENDRLGGKDPYSASKGMAELAIRCYVASFFSSPDCPVRVGVTRAGNVIGGGDWAEDRIVPDCMQAWSRGETVGIRSPEATRPWQHVLEPLGGYLSLAAVLHDNSKFHGNAYNFGPPAHQNHSVCELIEAMKQHWENVRWQDTSESKQFHEASLLKLNCDKALFDLNWQPTLQFEETVRMTVEWYKHYYDGDLQSMHDFTLAQIDVYMELAKTRGRAWAQV
ncbi:MAG: CDP-glucose 4,6-dehydratase [Gammaproteobacteria bacterium]|nr:CDP-glucose 4,6-dehydratase [Gammaproteobacteria bacterium]